MKQDEKETKLQTGPHAGRGQEARWEIPIYVTESSLLSCTNGKASALLSVLLIAAEIAQGQSAPTITQDLTNQSVLAGSTVNLGVGVSGSGPFSYQWQFNGTNIPNAIITTVAGDGGYGYYYGDGGPATSASLDWPFGVAVDIYGNLFIADNANNRIREVGTNGIINTIAGSGACCGASAGYGGDGGPATNALLSYAKGVDVDAYGNVFIADTGNNRIRIVTSNGIINTLAGNGAAGYSGDGGVATNAALSGPQGLALDAFGNVYVADSGNGAIREVETNGLIVTVAGGGTMPPGGGGAATNVALSNPAGVTLDAFGNLFISDTYGSYVFKVGTNGLITTVAGTGGSGYSGDGGPATNAELSYYTLGVAVDSWGDVFISDSYNYRVREVRPNGTITTIAGNGQSGFSGDGGIAVNAELSGLSGLAMDAQSNLYIADSANERIRKVVFPPTLLLTAVSSNNTGSYDVVVTSPYGSVTSSIATFTVLLPPALVTQPQNQTNIIGSNATFAVTATGTAPLSYQWFYDGVAVTGQTNSVFAFTVTAMTNAGSYNVVVTNLYGAVTSAVATLNVVWPPTITAQPQSQAVLAGSSATFSIAVSGTGPFLYQWQYNGTNLPNDVITLFAGTGALGFSGDGGPATSAELTGPDHLCMDAQGNLYIADAGTNRIRKVNPAGIISTVAGNGTRGVSGDGGSATNASLNAPDGVAVDAFGNVFVADSGNGRIRKVNTNGFISTVAGHLTNAYGGEGGQATNAELALPQALAVDSTGQLFIADTFNNRIRKVATNGIINTVAGSGPSYPGTGSFAGDGGPATSARIDLPMGIALDSYGNFFIADSGNNRIRRVGTNGIITTVAGTGTAYYNGDGMQATNATLYSPRDIVFDPAGNMLVADALNQRVRRVFTNGIITTIAGGGSDGGFLGQIATNAHLGDPAGLAADAYGNVFMAQTMLEPAQIAKVTLESSVLPLGNLAPTNSGNYNVIVTSPYGSVTSSVVTLTVLSPPSIAVQPVVNQTTIVGNTATFSVMASGTAPLSYQWQFDGVSLGGATNSALSLPDLTTNATGSYDVIVTNNYGSVTSIMAGLVVEPLPVISQQPSNQTVFLGGTTTLSVGASVGGPFAYQWQFNGVNLSSAEIITVAGYDSGDASTNMLVNSPFGLAIDSKGNIFVADEGLNRVCKISTNGVLTAVAGAINSEEEFVFNYFSGDGGPATNATMAEPVAVAVDGSGNLFIAAAGNGRVREVDTNGIINTVVGGGTNTPKNGIAATNLELESVEGLAVDSFGNLFVADASYNYVFKVSTNGIVTIYAGNGSQTVLYSGDGGPATNAALNEPGGLAVDAAGDLFITDEGNSRIREVNTSGVITTVAGNGGAAYTGDGGPATNASLNYPAAVMVDASGDLFIADTENNVIRKVGTNGVINTIAGKVAGGYGGDGGPATNALLSYPCGVAVDAAGDVIISDTENLRVRQLGANGVINNLAGGGIGDGGPAINAEVSDPFGVALDSRGNLFIADTLGNRIRKVGTNGFVTTVAGTGTNAYGGDGGPATNAELSLPFAVAPDSLGNLFIADYENARIRKVDANGIITTVAGGGTNTHGDGGPATNVSLSYPRAVAVDNSGDFYIADAGSNRIRMVNAGGIITTIAGTGVSGFSGDGGPATNAELSFPFGLALDQYGDLFITDSGNGRIRKVGTNGIITTVAGAGTNGLQADGVPAAAAALLDPTGVAVDGSGNIFFSASGVYFNSNYFNYRVCEVTASGTLVTVAGNGTPGYLGDGGPQLSAQLDPVGLAVSPSGAIYVAGYESDRVREIRYPTSTLSTLVVSNVSGGNMGSYDVVISNLYGSVTSSVVTLNVVLPPLTAAFATGQGVEIQSTGIPGYSYALLAATNLTPPINWQSLGTNTADANGNWSFMDANPANSARFYRAELVTP